MNTVEQNEKQSSIEVSRNAKGQYTFKVKTYYNEEETEAENVVMQTNDIMDDLIERFD